MNGHNHILSNGDNHVNGFCETRLKMTEDDVNSLLTLIRVNNNFLATYSKKKDVVPFFVDGKLVGLIKEAFLPYLASFPEVFQLDKARVENGHPEKIVRLSDNLTSCKARTEALRVVVNQLRQHSDALVTLKGWRDEDYSVYHQFHEGPLFVMERAATCIFGIRRYGVHINGFVRNKATGAIESMWIAQRALDKPTYPGLLDNMAAGGLTSGYRVIDVAKKELQEEASVSDEVFRNLRPVGTLSYCYEDERGICPELLYIYDLELTSDFRPKNSDGEVQGFVLKSIAEVYKLIMQPNFKPNSALVILDFLIRHSFVTPEHSDYYGYFVQSMHVDPFAHFAPLVPCPRIV